MGILDGFPAFALYLFKDSYEVGSNSLIDWNGSEEDEFDFSLEHDVFWPERRETTKGRKLKLATKSYSAKVLCFNDSKLTLRGIAKDIASGAITIEDVEKNYQAPAETPCSEDRERRTMKSQFNSQTFKMLTENSAANGDAAESDDSIQQSLSSISSYKKRNIHDDEVGSSSNVEANKSDDVVSDSLAYPATSSSCDESTSHTSEVGKSGTKFLISMKVVEKLSKDAKINLFITRLLDYLYTEEFMAKTTVTSKRNKSASPSEKGQLDEKELREIIDVTNKRFPPSDVDAQEKLIRTTVGVKFNNVAAKLKKQLLLSDG
ncbi:Uncharacterized protein APZ42_025369 [Daphnia magna]|uniref:BEN domain-containing protein n=1 Tax=Daphnia magna TaxID=35525 RepID=A0A164T5M1_9CRUS|nr:Uncharacterized protein APZ42_025369 [Daphnia magna]